MILWVYHTDNYWYVTSTTILFVDKKKFKKKYSRPTTREKSGNNTPVHTTSQVIACLGRGRGSILSTVFVVVYICLAVGQYNQQECPGYICIDHLSDLVSSTDFCKRKTVVSLAPQPRMHERGFSAQMWGFGWDGKFRLTKYERLKEIKLWEGVGTFQWIKLPSIELCEGNCFFFRLLEVQIVSNLQWK